MSQQELNKQSEEFGDPHAFHVFQTTPGQGVSPENVGCHFHFADGAIAVNGNCQAMGIKLDTNLLNKLSAEIPGGSSGFAGIRTPSA
jgi:hypothetical protein